jgi:hypothetical protein
VVVEEEEVVVVCEGEEGEEVLCANVRGGDTALSFDASCKCVCVRERERERESKCE